ncbi:MAG: xanthine dehydrogenase family protein subunit M, partial [Chloroflexi bacterium]|nr:xanthine dehydrogenase family protein subunit M [Chloroflexota bacterium]
MWKNYYSVTTIDEALNLLEQYQDRARIVAGGTDIIIELERGRRQGIDTLIDITRVPGLNTITTHNNQIHMGALVTHNQVVDSQHIINNALPLAQACWEVGAPQIRNRATVAGNLITASPANDTITPLWALGASVTLQSTSGERVIPLPEFYTGIRETAMRPDEMMREISFNPLGENERGVFLKLGLRRAQAIAVINVCVILAFDGDVITGARIALGSVAPTIVRVPESEAFLRGKTLSDDVIRQTAVEVSQYPRPIDDVRGTAVYRTEMLKMLTARALRQLRDKAQGASFPQRPAMLWGDNASSSLQMAIRHEDDA